MRIPLNQLYLPFLLMTFKRFPGALLLSNGHRWRLLTKILRLPLALAFIEEAIGTTIHFYPDNSGRKLLEQLALVQ